VGCIPPLAPEFPNFRAHGPFPKAGHELADVREKSITYNEPQSSTGIQIFVTSQQVW